MTTVLSVTACWPKKIFHFVNGEEKSDSLLAYFHML